MGHQFGSAGRPELNLGGHGTPPAHGWALPSIALRGGPGTTIAPCAAALGATHSSSVATKLKRGARRMMRAGGRAGGRQGTSGWCERARPSCSLQRGRGSIDTSLLERRQSSSGECGPGTKFSTYSRTAVRH
eukprot:SAG31_NODE_699_length_12741_cov_5.762617_10_plen_132_part_00